MPDFSFLTRHWLLKVLSLVIGISLWYFVVGEDQVDMNVTIPLEMRNLPTSLVIANQYRRDVEVTIRGPRRMIQDLRQQNLSRPVDLSKAEPGPLVINNDAGTFSFPRGISVQRVQPANITLQVDRLIQKRYLLTVETKGKPASGFVLDKVTLKPSSLSVTGPQTLLDEEKSLRVMPVSIDGLDRSTTLQSHLQLTEPLLKLIGETVVDVQVGIREIMLKKTVRGIQVNGRLGENTVKTSPHSVTVEAEIPEQVVRQNPELSLLFRASAIFPADRLLEEAQVQVNGITLPDHAPIVILNISPDKVRLQH